MTSTSTIPSGKRIFVNRTLNMNHIKLIGFDMDYTVVTYNVPEFENLAYKLMQEKLVSERGFPEEILQFKFDPEFIIRGLVIDTEHGNILKVNCFGYVKKVAHGTRFLSVDEGKKLYPVSSIDLNDPRYYIVHTLFSLAEGYLFAQMVDFFNKENIPVNFRKVFNDVRETLDQVHQEGKLKGAVTEHPEKYLQKTPETVEALKRLKKSGKKLALITNSDYDYSKKVMDYCFTPFLNSPWQDLFDLIVVVSNKPLFFQARNKFLKVDRETGALSNHYEPVRYGNIYQGGNAKYLQKNLSLNPSEILYLGDHLYGDVVTLKESLGWRTGLVIQELETEVPGLEKNSELMKNISLKMAEKEQIEDELCLQKEKYLETLSSASEGETENYHKIRDELRSRIEKIDLSLQDYIMQMQKKFNPRWGEVMRAGNEESRLATLVEMYACVYMSSVGNLQYYSPLKYFRPPRRLLAHDPNPDDYVGHGTPEDIFEIQRS
ncbi:MAG: HAD-IG family 5'-nucleotidase [Candidatus Riflebacteria bacterium]|nr:HAD-IG family 5'-nucleotidase [Candidatus Riflebacteria bacterium]